MVASRTGVETDVQAEEPFLAVGVPEVAEPATNPGLTLGNDLHGIRRFGHARHPCSGSCFQTEEFLPWWLVVLPSGRCGSAHRVRFTA